MTWGESQNTGFNLSEDIAKVALSTPASTTPGHKAGREIGYCHLEKLHNLEALPDHGFTVCCFPVKVERASAGWTRAVAILE